MSRHVNVYGLFRARVDWNEECFSLEDRLDFLEAFVTVGSLAVPTSCVCGDELL